MMTKCRIQTNAIPNTSTNCYLHCEYSNNTICDNPRLNKGNSDATCFKFTNKKLVEYLKDAKI